MTTGGCQLPIEAGLCGLTTNGSLCTWHARSLKAKGLWLCSNAEHAGDRVLPRPQFRTGPAGWRTRPDCLECERRMARERRMRPRRDRAAEKRQEDRRRLLAAAAMVEQRERDRRRDLVVRIMAGNARWLA